MTFTRVTVVLILVGLLLLIAAVRNLRRRRVAGGLLQGTSSFALFALATAVALVAANLHTYQRLSAEQPVGRLLFTKIGYHQYNGVFTAPDGSREDFALRGDEWQVDARILKWQPFATLVGFDAVYRLDRISGRYTDLEDERTLPRTVYPLNAPERIDLWELARRHHSWIPWFDALYGSATFLPMSDGAEYEISVTQSGLLARPLNQAAREATGNWH